MKEKSTKTRSLRWLVQALEYDIKALKNKENPPLDDLLDKKEKLFNLIEKGIEFINTDNSKGLEDDLVVLGNFKHRLSILMKSDDNLEVLSSFLEELYSSITLYIFSLDEALNKTNYDLQLKKEQMDVERGMYQELTFYFTYENKDVLFLNNHANIFVEDSHYFLFGLLNIDGLRCTVAIPQKFNSREVGIYVNFFGTVDLDSIICDIETGGPGHKTIKKHQALLVKKIHDVIHQLASLHPGHTFKLIIMGHSLGGAFAKNCAYILQRAIAVQKNSTKDIIKRIKRSLSHDQLSQDDIENLKEQLNFDEEQFEGLDALNNILRIIVYAWGAPGVSEETNRLAILMTHFFDEDYLRMYHHFHIKDSIKDLGPAEYLIPEEDGIPPNCVNQFIQYDVPITKEEIEESEPLPFPGCGKKVMVAHKKRIYPFSEEERNSKLVEPKEKRKFSSIEQFPYRVFYSLMKNSPGSKRLIKPFCSIWKPTVMEDPNIENLDDHRFYTEYKIFHPGSDDTSSGSEDFSPPG